MDCFPALIRPFVHDLCRDSRWHHNVVRHCTYAGFVLKHHNVVEDNLFIDPLAPLLGLLVVRRDPCDLSSVRRNVFLNSASENLPAVRLEHAQGLKDVDANVYWAVEDEAWAQEALKAMQDRGFERRGAVVEIRFKDVDNRDFRIEPDSRLSELGIEGVDLREVGPA